MFGQVRFCQFMSVILCIGLISSAIGCGADDDNPWVGTWNLETFEGESVQEQVAEAKIVSALLLGVDFSYSDIWTFNDDETWERNITTMVGETGVYAEVTGTYSLSDSDYTLTPTFSTIPGEESDADSDVVIGPNISGPFGNTEMDAGTWLLDGDILTLTSETGKVYGFKKE